jgi:elongation factor G
MAIGKEADFKGVVDLVNFKSIIWQDDSLGAKFDVIDISEDLLEEAKLKREELIENAVEADDKAMEDYLEGKEISVETLKSMYQKGHY